jgi:hypothetical protein
MTFYEKYQEGFENREKLFCDCGHILNLVVTQEENPIKNKWHCENCGKIFTVKTFLRNLPEYKKKLFEKFRIFKFEKSKI